MNSILFSGYQPDQPVSEVQIKVFVPNVTIAMNTNSVLRVTLLTVKPHGSITMNFGMYVYITANISFCVTIFILTIF